MSDLEKAVVKAVGNGWLSWFRDPIKTVQVVSDPEDERVEIWLNRGKDSLPIEGSLYGIIFDQDFARALWGDKLGTITLENWQYHLQNMVISENPMVYLGEHFGDS